MDDSISCSPTLNTNKSFHMQRERRKCKRKGMEKEMKEQSNDHNYVQSPHPLGAPRIDQIDEELDNPYDQTFQVHSPSTTRRIQRQLHSEMFDDVFTLADHIDCEQAARTQKQRKGLKSTQGFQTASQNLTDVFYKENCESDLLGIENEFSLTKTQLFNCYDRLDQNDPSQSSITKLDTNRTSMSIVDIILHDFCSSPEYKADELMINDAVTAAPYFRFRGQIIKTYSRNKTQHVPMKKHDQVDQQMEHDDDDRVSSCSSDLSVQEDLTNSTQLPAVVISNIDLNSSQRLCQNLLNISAFFTANTEEDSITPNRVKDCGNLKSTEITFESCSEITVKPLKESQMLIEQITFDKKYSNGFNEDISWSFDDYHWFTSHNSIQSPVNLKEPEYELEDKHSSLSEIVPICDTEKNCDNKPITEKLNTFNSSEMISKKCDDHLTIEASKNDESKKEANISLKSDDWFNDDFDYDFNTEDILIKTKEDFVISENHRRIKIDATKAESVEDLKLPKDKKASMQIEYIEEKPCTSRQAMQRINAIHTNKETDDHENKLKDFSSNSKMNEHQEDEEFNYELSQWLLDDVAKQKSTTKTVGFCTARNKSIHVSEAAKLKVASIVSELPALPVKTNKNKRESYPMITKNELEDTLNEIEIDKLRDDELNCNNMELSQWLLDDIAKQNCDNELEPQTVVGFCTAGNKRIQVSDEAKRKAATIVSQLPELPEKSNNDKTDPTNINMDSLEAISNETLDSKINELQVDEENVCDSIELSQWLLDDVGKEKSDNELKPPTVVAFYTAGNKSIQVSDAAKRKAASIVAELPELPIKSNIDELECDVTISTEQIESSSNEVVDSKINKLHADEENICDSIELSQWLLDDVGKPKCANELKAPTVVEICTAGNKNVQVSDATIYKASSIVADLPELPVKDRDKIEGDSYDVVDSKINELQVDGENFCDNIELSQWLLDDNTKEKWDNELEPPTAMDFGTTGNQSIKVSDAEKRKSISIDSELFDLSNKNSKQELIKEITNKRKLEKSLIETSVEKIKKNNELEDEQLGCNKIELRKCSLDETAYRNSINNLKPSNNIEIRKCSLDEAAYRSSLKPSNFPKTLDKSKINARINLRKWEVRSVDFSSQKNYDGKERRLSLLNDITKEKTADTIESTTINACKKATSIVSQLPYFPEQSIKELKCKTTTNKRKLEETNIEISVEKIQKLNDAEDEEALDCDNLELSKWLLNDVTDHITGTEISSTPIVDFCTAENKSTHVAETASIVSQLPVFSKNKTNKPNNEECENVPNVINKIKLKDSFTETPVKSSVIILSKSQTLENFRTPQSSFPLSATQSSLKQLFVRSPLERYKKSSLISRKNLLTLNYKRKLGHSQNDDECTDTMENMMNDDDHHTEELEEIPTPVKQMCLHQMEINQTPRNSKAYMNSLATSTPQPLKSINGEISYDLESDFQHINWQQEEGDLSKTLTNSATKPSPKERIERLRVYGDPPALSPITTATISSLSSSNVRSFRAPGLRRRRILSKPK